MAHQPSESELSLRRSQRLASVSTQQLHEIKAKLEQCKAELNSTTEGEEGERAQAEVFQGELFFKLRLSGANSNIISLTAKLHPLDLSF